MLDITNILTWSCIRHIKVLLSDNVAQGLLWYNPSSATSWWTLSRKYVNQKKPQNLRGWSSLSKQWDLEPHLNKLGIGTKKFHHRISSRTILSQPDMPVAECHIWFVTIMLRPIFPDLVSLRWKHSEVLRVTAWYVQSWRQKNLLWLALWATSSLPWESLAGLNCDTKPLYYDRPLRLCPTSAMISHISHKFLCHKNNPIIKAMNWCSQLVTAK